MDKEEFYDVDTENGIERVQICKNYYNKYLSGFSSIWALFAKNIGFLILPVNFGCRQIFIQLAKKVGYTSVTMETEFIKYGVFIVYFFNTSLLYIFAPWDSREVDSSFLNGIFQGVYTDLNMHWFKDIGNTIA